jgi:GPI ethanolamine phosphate transferase 3 subunit O
MIDALRFDFMQYDPLLLSSNTPHFKNKLPILRDLLERKPQNSLLFRGMADPPTTTLQRLMAIMTGALPTLVDAGSNFASAALKEDNLIEKVR